LDQSRNLDVDPWQLACGAHRKVWWRCAEWQAVKIARAWGAGVASARTPAVRASVVRDRWPPRVPDLAAELD
jgi:hypothetical protein